MVRYKDTPALFAQSYRQRLSHSAEDKWLYWNRGIGSISTMEITHVVSREDEQNVSNTVSISIAFGLSTVNPYNQVGWIHLLDLNKKCRSSETIEKPSFTCYTFFSCRKWWWCSLDWFGGQRKDQAKWMVAIKRAAKPFNPSVYCWKIWKICCIVSA